MREALDKYVKACRAEDDSFEVESAGDNWLQVSVGRTTPKTWMVLRFDTAESVTCWECQPNDDPDRVMSGEPLDSGVTPESLMPKIQTSFEWLVAGPKEQVAQFLARVEFGMTKIANELGIHYRVRPLVQAPPTSLN